ncbi:MAG: GFA family protein [Pseudomonadales bacterium]|jgi:hypothetical protein|nr:GFA family protein [Pseudomonadales bacterium]MDP6470591.1 GFA family protein [Pseudomonadales bacterium]MDP6828554.1 GFA family protein [Pseudomonadales bacterium]MDP6972040.1 GFA family protein [Pseudomonadales bacterium]|tara:strand:- start:1839 stop:2288 length:450 start_codon:yes stop_codon:yes gene_type:complete
MSYRGSCLCGAITYTLNAELSDFGYCHCEQCRKASGAAFGANAGVDRAHVDLSDPGDRLTEYASSPGKVRAFCGGCGTPLFAYLTTTPHLIRIRLGSLDSDFLKTAKAHAFVAEKADWYPIEDGLPQFDTWADPDILVQVGSRQSQKRR